MQPNKFEDFLKQSNINVKHDEIFNITGCDMEDVLKDELAIFRANNPDGLSPDDMEWFTKGEKAVRNEMPYAEELSNLIKNIQQSSRPLNKKALAQYTFKVENMGLSELRLILIAGNRHLQQLNKQNPKH